jgi:hypothetical protein
MSDEAFNEENEAPGDEDDELEDSDKENEFPEEESVFDFDEGSRGIAGLSFARTDDSDDSDSESETRESAPPPSPQHQSGLSSTDASVNMNQPRETPQDGVAFDRSVGPHPSFIQVANPYIFEQGLQNCLTTLGATEHKEDSIRLQGVNYIDNVRKALQL